MIFRLLGSQHLYSSADGFHALLHAGEELYTRVFIIGLDVLQAIYFLYESSHGKEL